MLEDFLKGNHYTIKLATVPWPREVNGCLSCDMEWAMPSAGKAGRYGRHHGQDRWSQGREASSGYPRAQSAGLRGSYEPVRTDGTQSMSLELGAEVKQRQQVRQRWRTGFPGTYSARGAGAMADRRVAGPAQAAWARGRARAGCAGAEQAVTGLGHAAPTN
jgi:hypothetical protein